jgi:hypothetical protein
MLEDAILTHVTVTQLLARLDTADRELLVMALHYEQPDDYAGPWPATLRDVGQFIGTKYFGQPISEGRVRARRREIVTFLQHATEL